MADLDSPIQVKNLRAKWKFSDLSEQWVLQARKLKSREIKWLKWGQTTNKSRVQMSCFPGQGFFTTSRSLLLLKLMFI